MASALRQVLMHSESVGPQLLIQDKVSSMHTSLQTWLSSRSLEKCMNFVLLLGYSYRLLKQSDCTYGQLGSTRWPTWCERATPSINRTVTLILKHSVFSLQFYLQSSPFIPTHVMHFSKFRYENGRNFPKDFFASDVQAMEWFSISPNRFIQP